MFHDTMKTVLFTVLHSLNDHICFGTLDFKTRRFELEFSGLMQTWLSDEPRSALHKRV